MTSRLPLQAPPGADTKGCARGYLRAQPRQHLTNCEILQFSISLLPAFPLANRVGGRPAGLVDDVDDLLFPRRGRLVR
ncbi:hypothetical protein GCM10022207_47480 [Streptomyces lannensis]|uniref:Uncharacterized protein n=1 Tax=Streptomyces lannensis TaxID=766498 RepID=A0ABP7KFM9_9ACTN